MKLKNDKYYTPSDLALKLIKLTFKVLKESGVDGLTDINLLEITSRE